jgi:glycosyltransferase involved in cell wall biosynthesis
MSNSIILTIVSPTRGNFSDSWFEHLCKITGNVEFILVYPPDSTTQQISDPRFKLINSPFKGEVIQRLLGLLNASGKYVLALDDDDYIHPDIIQLVIKYFDTFPDSWCLRLRKKIIHFKQLDEIHQPWNPIPNIEEMKSGLRKNGDDVILQLLPIAPLNNRFNLRCIFDPYLKRKDMHGSHIENFTNKVWPTKLVKQALTDITQVMIIGNALTWIPRWNLDRMLGLFIQAKFFEEGKHIGHWMPEPEQIRYVSMPQDLKKEFRLMFPADALLVKRFPQYGYFWNLFFEQFWVAVKKIFHKWTNL